MRAPPSENDVSVDQSEASRKKKTRSSMAGISSGGGDEDQAVPFPPDSGHGQQSFLSSIFLHLAEARKELESLASFKKTGGLRGAGGNATGVVGDQEEHAVRVRLQRCLALVKGVIRGAPGIMTPAHSNRGMGLPWEVTLMVKAAPTKHVSGGGISGGSNSSSSSGAATASMVSSVRLHAAPPPLAGAAATPASSSSSTAWNSGPPDKYVIEVHPLETVGLLRARVAATNGLGNGADYTRLLCGGKALNVDGVTVADAGVTDGASIWTVGSSNAVPGVLNTSGGGAVKHAGSGRVLGTSGEVNLLRRKGSIVIHDGDVIAKQTGPFNELFRLLNCAHGLEVRKVVLHKGILFNHKLEWGEGRGKGQGGHSVR